jgi:hypothetical protein
VASSASLEPSVARSTVVGKMLIPYTSSRGYIFGDQPPNILRH